MWIIYGGLAYRTGTTSTGTTSEKALLNEGDVPILNEDDSEILTDDE